MKDTKTHLFDLKSGIFTYLKDTNSLVAEASTLGFEVGETPYDFYVYNSETGNERNFVFMGYNQEEGILVYVEENKVSYGITGLPKNPKVDGEIISFKEVSEHPKALTVEVLND